MCWSCLGTTVLVGCLRNGRLFFFNPGLHNADPNPTRSFPQLLGDSLLKVCTWVVIITGSHSKWCLKRELGDHIGRWIWPWNHAFRVKLHVWIVYGAQTSVVWLFDFVTNLWFPVVLNKKFWIKECPVPLCCDFFSKEVPMVFSRELTVS
jgi:hypothetical protein